MLVGISGGVIQGSFYLHPGLLQPQQFAVASARSRFVWAGKAMTCLELAQNLLLYWHRGWAPQYSCSENLGNSAKRNFGKRLFDEADTSVCNSLSRDSECIWLIWLKDSTGRNCSVKPGVHPGAGNNSCYQQRDTLMRHPVSVQGTPGLPSSF